MTQEELNHLNFIYDRMVYVHKEHINVDYIRKFRHILCQEQTSLVGNKMDKLLENDRQVRAIKPQLENGS